MVEKCIHVEFNKHTTFLNAWLIKIKEMLFVSMILPMDVNVKFNGVITGINVEVVCFIEVGYYTLFDV